MKRIAIVSALALLLALPAAANVKLGAEVIQTPTGPQIKLTFTQATVTGTNGTCPAGSTASATTILKNTVYRATTPGGEPAPGGASYAVISPAATTYTDTGGTAGFTPGTTYYYKVTASNCNSESAESNEASAQIPNPVGPNAPTNLTAQPVTSSSIGLKWDPVASNVPVLYDIFRCENKSRNWQKINAFRAKHPWYDDTDLQPGNTYHYQVKAWTASGGESGYSNQASVFLP
jgi:hypothetical protein